jgi:hypothetical protein
MSADKGPQGMGGHGIDVLLACALALTGLACFWASLP